MVPGNLPHLLSVEHEGAWTTCATSSPKNSIIAHGKCSLFFPFFAALPLLAIILNENCSKIMKSSTLFYFYVFDCGLLPPYVHVVLTWCHSCDRCSQAFPIFCCFSTSGCYTEHKPNNKTGKGLGTRLGLYVLHYLFYPQHYYNRIAEKTNKGGKTASDGTLKTHYTLSFIF